jgi:hypothetical protein
LVTTCIDVPYHRVEICTHPGDDHIQQWRKPLLATMTDPSGFGFGFRVHVGCFYFCLLA